MRQWYQKWRWISRERASGWLPWKWWHLRVCPFCSGYMKSDLHREAQRYRKAIRKAARI